MSKIDLYWTNVNLSNCFRTQEGKHAHQGWQDKLIKDIKKKIISKKSCNVQSLRKLSHNFSIVKKTKKNNAS